MKKNPQFDRLSTIANDICKSSFSIIASNRSEPLQDSLSYDPYTKTYTFEFFRFNDKELSTKGIISVHEDSCAPFLFTIHDYNENPPYIEINLGKITSILHFNFNT